MNSFNKLVCGFLFGAVLSACGAEDFDDDTAEARYAGPPINDENRDITLSEISGIWEIEVEIKSVDENGQIVESHPVIINEFVRVITEDGQHFDYDYQGDPKAEMFGYYRNCYVKQNEAAIEKKPEGGFSLIEQGGADGFIITFTTNTNFDIKDGKLVSGLSPFIWNCKCDPQIIQMDRSDLTIEYLDSMLCED